MPADDQVVKDALAALAPPTEEELKKKYEDREYQTYLYQRALEENVIICLPTGCGKTFIAVKAVLHYLVEALENDKKIIFLATTVPLVHQQGKYLKDHIGNAYASENDMVGIVTGDMKPEDWDGGKWKLIIARHVVFAMTDQILRHAVERGHIRWDKLSLIILDECHNATKNHPMASLMAFYGQEFRAKKVPGVDLPRVIGLSATIVIGNSKVDKIPAEIDEMERKLCCKAITYHDYEAVLKCATQAAMSFIPYPAAPEWKISGGNITFKLSDYLVEIVEELEMMESFLVSKHNDIPEGLDSSEYRVFWNRESPIKEFIRHIAEIQEILTEMGPFCAENAVLYKIALFRYLAYKEKRKRGSSSNTLSGQQIILNWLESRLEFAARQLRHFMFYASPENTNESYQAVHLVSPKIRRLIEVLKAHKPGPVTGEKDFCGIVFCQKRITAQMLCYYLQDLRKYCPDTYGFLNCSFTLGTSGTNNAVVQTVALRMQSDILEKFRQKRLNILVATKVLEEGLDVPSCNFICRFDPILSYPSFIQSMGRARQQGAKFYALVPSVTAKAEIAKLRDYETFSGALSDALVKNVEVPERYYWGDEDGSNDTELNIKIPPFRPTGGPSMITAGSATQIVYRYCEDLTSDKLSTLSPYAKWRTKDGMFQVCVCLPPSSCVKYAESGWYSGKTVAKKAAFLEVCKKLYAASVLHEETLLPIPKAVPTHLSEFVENLEDFIKQPKDEKKIGSKNRIQWYQKKIPMEFMKRSTPENLSVYLIEITLEAYYAKDDIKPLLEFKNHQYFFGIVTAAELEKVPDFLLFSRDGNFRVNLQKVILGDGNEDVPLTEDMLRRIKNFQSLLFSKDPELMSFNHPVFSEADDHAYYIAPLKRGENRYFEVATDIMKHLQDLQGVQYDIEMSMADRRKRTFVPEDFADALIVPCYTPKFNERQKYCVLGVDPIRTAKSEFDDPSKAGSFAEYYQLKHDIVVVNRDDPLLQAKAISKQLNYLVAKYAAWKMTSVERREAKHCSSLLSLLAELMRVHPLPASLFVQSKMLPSIIHRIQRLLLAEELQSSVIDFILQRQAADSVETAFDFGRSDADLKKLNEEMKEIAIASLELDPKPVNKVITIAPVTADVEIKHHSMDLFTLKRKLYWVEIEYIHPRNIQRKDLEDPLSSDDEDAEDLPRPPSPSIAEKIGITLIPSSEVPCENFDNYNPNGDQPLLISIVEAMTLANAQDFLDLERFELIGDSVLKLVVTLHIFTHFPQFNEGQLTSLRTKLLSNRHLCVVGGRKQLGEYLAGGLFHPESCWLPPGVKIAQNLTDIAVKNKVNYSVFYPTLNRRDVGMEIPLDLTSPMDDEQLNAVVKERVENCQREIQEKGHMNTSYTHSRLGDKSIADCLEAMIGCYYLTGGLPGALNLMGWIGLRGPTSTQPAEQVLYGGMHELPRIDSEYPSHSQMIIPSIYVKQMEDMLEYTFKNKWLIVEAFTHPSYLENTSTNAYQRLEFLGDAILDFLITHHIYNKKKIKTAGLLTDLRSALVNNVTFGSQAVRYGLHKSLQHFSPKLQEGIDRFVRCQERANHQVTGLAFQYLTDNDCVMAEDIDVPKALGDIFESLAGAVFIDSGMSLDTVWRVFYRLMKHEIDIFSEDIPRHPIRQLHERFPTNIKFEVVPMPENTTDSKFVVQLKIGGGRKQFLGCGLTKKSAKVAAAKYALKHFEEEERKIAKAKSL